jgi:hypothetical protein
MAIAGAGGEPPLWVHLMPAGEFMAADGRGPFRLEDAEAVAALSLPAGGKPLPIDYDHAIDLAAPKGWPAPAAGWIERIEARSGALWGLVRWTERAAAKIRSLEYRSISPVFQHLREGGRIVRILRASLVNNPALDLVELAAALPAGCVTIGLELASARGLTPDEARVAAALGIDAAAFRASRAQIGRERAAFRDGPLDLALAARTLQAQLAELGISVTIAEAVHRVQSDKIDSPEALAEAAQVYAAERMRQDGVYVSAAAAVHAALRR